MALIDSYALSNYDNYWYFVDGSPTNANRMGPLVTATASWQPDSVVFRIGKNGSPTGPVWAEIYQIHPPYGYPYLSANLPVAVSNSVDATSIAASPTATTFTFPSNQRPYLSAGTHLVVVRYQTATNGTDRIHLGFHNASTTPFNAVQFYNSNGNGFWTTIPEDVVFEMYGTYGQPPSFMAFF